MTLTEILCAVILTSLLAIGFGDFVRQSNAYEARINDQVDQLRSLRRARIELRDAARMEPLSYIDGSPPSYQIGQKVVDMYSPNTITLSYRLDSYFVGETTDGKPLIKTFPWRDVAADCEYDLILRDCR